MDKATGILYLIVGGLGGAAVIYILTRLGFKLPTNPFNPQRPGPEKEKEINITVDRDTQLGTKPEEMKEEVDSGDVVDKQADKIRKRFLSVLLLFCISGIQTDIRAEDKEKIDPVLDNYLLETGNFVRMTGREFQSLRKEDRKDTKIVILDKTPTTKTVEFQMPVKEPILKELSNGLMKAEYKNADPIVRKVKVTCNDAGPAIAETSSRFWLYPIIGLMVSLNSGPGLDIQPSALLEFFHWTNEYMKLSASVFGGTKRYGLGISAGPALYLSNIRLVVAYSREYSSEKKEHYIEVGVSTLLYVN